MATLQNIPLSDELQGSSHVFPAGMIFAFASDSIPAGWLLCDGANVSTTTYASLFNVVGYTYNTTGKFRDGIDPPGTFTLPDFKGRVSAGVSVAGPIEGFSSIGTQSGFKTQNISQVPPHSHTGGTHDHKVYTDQITLDFGSQFNAEIWVVGSVNNILRSLSTEGSGRYTGQTSSTNSAHNNLQPYMVTNYIIKT